ncbi:MAG: ATP synthase [Myxococcales bacterium]
MSLLPWSAIEGTLETARPIRACGKVLRAAGLLVDATLPGARLGMSVRLMIPGHSGGVPAEVVSISDGVASLMPLLGVPGLTTGTEVRPVIDDQTVGVGDHLIGRVIDGWGNPLDGGPPLHDRARYPLQPAPLNPMDRGLIEHPLPLGIVAVDGLLTCGEGQRVAILAGAGVGKSTLLGMMARHTGADVTVVGLVGERSREVKRFVDVDLGPEGRKRAVVVAATSNTAAALRIRAARTATAVAEYFRDQGMRVLLLMDSLTRVAMAQRELGLATGEPPTTRGYPPSAFAIIPQLLERAGMGVGVGSITGFYTALLEGDDLGDPIGDAIRATTDGHVLLSRRLAERGHFPAIDVLGSVSRVMPEVVTPDHRDAAAAVRRCLADLREVEELLALGAYERGSVVRFDRALSFADEILTALRQPAEEPRDFTQSCARVAAIGRKIIRAEEARR